MADLYMNLSRDDYKELERQCKTFHEGIHGEGTPYYHKSFVVRVAGITIEFHGPAVKAREPFNAN